MKLIMSPGKHLHTHAFHNMYIHNINSTPENITITLETSVFIYKSRFSDIVCRRAVYF